MEQKAKSAHYKLKRKLMTPKETIAEIKRMLGFSVEEPAPAPAPVGTVYKLADGTEVTIDKLEIGGKVLIGDQAAPDGVHNLEDGTAVTVAEGVITEVKKAAEDPAPTPLETKEQMRAALEKFAEGAAPDQANLVVIVKALFESVFGWELRHEAEKAAREQAIAVYKQGFAAQEQIIANQKEAITKLTELVEQIAETPAEEKVEDTPEWEAMTPLQRFRASKQAFNQN